MARQGPSIAARASTGLRRPCRAARRWERPNHTPDRSSQVLNGGMNLPGGSGSGLLRPHLHHVAGGAGGVPVLSENHARISHAA